MKPDTARRRPLTRRRLRLTARTAVAAPVLAAVAALGVLPLLAPAPPADACGPFFPQPAFWRVDSTGVPWERMIDGELGILDARVDALELFVAYRHLAGPPLTAADRQVLAGFEAPPPPGPWWPQEGSWRKVRRELAWIEPMPSLFFRNDRVVRRELPNGGGVEVRYVLNCLTDAFDTATETLSARRDTYGADSPELAEWVRGQDQVFANCNEGQTIPEPLGDEWPEALRHDRDYQIAAAHFYAVEYAEAERRFRAIGEDERSPWRHLARYLVARAQARDRRWDEAVETLRALAADPAQAERQESIRGLIDHYRYRSVPGELHAEKRRALLASPLPASAHQDWIDFAATFHASDPALGPTGAAAGDLDRWIAAFVRPLPYERPVVAPTDALAVWRGGASSRHWLVAALVATVPQEGAAPSSLDDLLAAAATVDPAAPEATTVAFHRARLLLALGRDAEAVEVLDGLLARGGDDGDEDGGLPLAARNRVLSLRAAHAETLGDYLRWSQMTPAALTLDGSYWPPWNREPLPVLLSDQAAQLLDRFTAAEQAAVVESEVMEPGLRRRLAGTAWTRAVVLGDEATAVRLAPLVARLDPELSAEMERYLAASGDTRLFAAVHTLLRHPGLTPQVDGGLSRDGALTELDPFRQNWWCPSPETWWDEEENGPFRAPAFAADAPDDELRAQTRAALDALPSGPIWLGDRAINHADRHPGDPRVPEALHRTVRATRYGCTYYDEDVEAVSKDAWQRLHRRYAESPWTERTPYWFD